MAELNGKPIAQNPVADLPTNWQTGQIVSPNGTDVGLSQKHGYNYLAQKINEALTDLGVVNEFCGDLADAIAGILEEGIDASLVNAGTLAGKVVANAAAVTDSSGQVRNIYYGTTEPGDSLGNNGDIYIQLEAQ